MICIPPLQTFVGSRASALSRCVLLLVFLTVLSACGGVGGRLVEPPPEAAAGWLVHSISIEYERGTYPNPFSTYEIGYASDEGALGFSTMHFGYSERRLAELDLFENGLHVMVFVKRLAPGDYQLTSGAMMAAQQSLRSRDFSHPFQIHDGKITYLGNFDARIIGGREILGLRRRNGGYYVVSDLHERDLALAIARESGAPLADAEVSNQTPYFPVWAGGVFISPREGVR